MGVPPAGGPEPTGVVTRPASVTVACGTVVALAVCTVLVMIAAAPMAAVLLVGVQVVVLLVVPAVLAFRGRHGGRVVLTTATTLIGFYLFRAVTTDSSSVSQVAVNQLATLALVASTALLWTGSAQTWFGRPGPSPVRPCAVAVALCGGWMIVVLLLFSLVLGAPLGAGYLVAAGLTISVAVSAGVPTHLFARRPGWSTSATVAVSFLLTFLVLVAAFGLASL